MFTGFLAKCMYTWVENCKNTPETIRKCKKSDKKQGTQSIENARNSVNFERAEEGLNYFHSARFKYI